MLIHLEPFLENDIENLVTWVDRPGASDLWASRTYPFPLSIETVAKHLEKTRKTPVELRVFKIIKNGYAKPVGHVELDKFDHHSNSARITRLFVDPEHRGSGIARQATKLLLKYCFQDLNLNRVEILAKQRDRLSIV